jgi:hypothetical protein
MEYGFIDPAEMTPGKAAQVRAWRVDQGNTWRGVAYEASATWGSRFGSNQLYGRELCVAAATLLGEDPDADPWN